MAAPEKPVTAAEIRLMLDQGKTYFEIAIETGYAEQTLRNRVTQEKKRTPDNNPTGWSFAPWWVRPAHTNTRTGRRLKYAELLRAGGKVPSMFIEDDVRSWLRVLDDNDLVISYHPDTPGSRFEKKGGFWARKRRPGDSPGIMQQPGPDECPPSQSAVREWDHLFD